VGSYDDSVYAFSPSSSSSGLLPQIETYAIIAVVVIVVIAVVAFLYLSLSDRRRRRGTDQGMHL
jgi:hypothetical protein